MAIGLARCHEDLVDLVDRLPILLLQDFDLPDQIKSFVDALRFDLIHQPLHHCVYHVLSLHVLVVRRHRLHLRIHLAGRVPPENRLDGRCTAELLLLVLLEHLLLVLPQLLLGHRHGLRWLRLILFLGPLSFDFLPLRGLLLELVLQHLQLGSVEIFRIAKGLSQISLTLLLHAGELGALPLLCLAPLEFLCIPFLLPLLLALRRVLHPPLLEAALVHVDRSDERRGFDLEARHRVLHGHALGLAREKGVRCALGRRRVHSRQPRRPRALDAPPRGLRDSAVAVAFALRGAGPAPRRQRPRRRLRLAGPSFLLLLHCLRRRGF